MAESGARRHFKIGVQLHPQQTSFEALREAYRHADSLGVESIWTWDHFFPLYGPPDGPNYEGWTSLTAIGLETRRAQVGCLVLSMSYRNPALLSAMATTLDHATGGRLILGVGAGWFERDYARFGYDFGTAGGRIRNLERGLETIKEHWAVDEPKPLRGTIPILIGGGGERVTLRIVAQHADLWNSFGPVEKWRGKNEILDAWCGKVGREAGAIERTVALNEKDLDTLDQFAEAGATHLIYGMGAPFDFRPVEQLLRWRDRQNGGN